MRDHILAIDQGTQSVRAMIFDLKGNLVTKSQVQLVPYASPQPGLAEQDPEYYWQKLGEACQQLWQETEVPKEAIAGVALTTMRNTVVNVDRDGKPLRPAIVWLDQRRAEGVKPVGGLWGLAFKLIGMTETVAYLQAGAQANWIALHQPRLWDQTHKFLFMSGYLTYRLVGQFVDSVSSQVGFVPFDYKKLAWCKGWDWKWQAIPGIKPRMLPRLIPPTETLGEITREASEMTGIPVGLPVIAAAADKACEVLGCGCVEPHMGCLSYGTAATINTTHKKYVEVIPLIPPYPSAIPGAYSLEIQIYRGFWMVSWFKQEFGLEERQRATELGVEPEFLFDDLISQVPPGSMGLILQPYWSPGLKVPGPEAKGAMIGFGDVHTRAHVYRAIVEGLAYALREGAEQTSKRSGVPITEIRVAGGGSQSHAAMQLTADVFGLPAMRPHTYEVSGLGAAMDAAVGLKLHPDFATAAGEMTRTGEVFEPNPRTREIYDGLYQRVYKQMYKKLRSLYQDIREITGYPAK
ncbi:MAG: FGGY-family carbohydrate kinase [Anaerolineae bacterium]|nr:FGGY-family carbohydrate kinase [Anaerolineae bacterium]